MEICHHRQMKDHFSLQTQIHLSHVIVEPISFDSDTRFVADFLIRPLSLLTQLSEHFTHLVEILI